MINYTIIYFISDTSTYNLSLNASLDYVSNPDYIIRTKSYKLILPYGYKFVTSKWLNYSVKYNYWYFLNIIENWMVIEKWYMEYRK